MTSTTALEVGSGAWYRRAAASMGVVSVALLLGALFLPGAPARTADPVAHLSQVLVDKRGAFTVGVYLGGLAVVALIVFLGAVRDFLSRHRADPAAAVTAMAGGALAGVLILVGMSCSTGVAVRAASMGDAGVIRAFTDTGNVLIELAKLGLAALVGGIVAATHPTHALPAPARLAGAISAAVLVVSALPPLLADQGAWQMGGPGDVAGYGPAAVWLSWLSISMVRRIPAPGTPGPADSDGLS